MLCLINRLAITWEGAASGSVPFTTILATLSAVIALAIFFTADFTESQYMVVGWYAN